MSSDLKIDVGRRGDASNDILGDIEKQINRSISIISSKKERRSISDRYRTLLTKITTWK